MSMLQVIFQDNAAIGLPPLLTVSACQAKLFGRSSFVDNTAALAGVVFIGDGATLEIQGDVCASNNTALPKNLPGTASFAYLIEGGSLRVADSASVQVDRDGPDVYIDSMTGPEPGVLYCGSDNSTTSWQPGSYNITGDL